MLIPFDPMKVAQAATVLLKTEPSRSMSRLRLLKLLYIADREALKERMRPITGDRPVAMDHGPVLSHTYDLIKGSDCASPTWERFLRSVGSRDLALADDPGVDKLSRYEIRKLQEVAMRYEHENDWAVAELTHDFEEWKKNKPPSRSSRAIPLDDLLAALGLMDRKQELLEIERVETSFERLLSSAAQ